jgi:hypothetical protein
MFWEYDTRLGRRWNVDPEGNDWESPYATLGNNPIHHKDEEGDVWNVVAGAVMGAAADYGVQVIANMADGKANPFTDNINLSSIALSAVEGGITSGASAIKTVTTKVAVVGATKVMTAVAKNTVKVKTENGKLKTEVETDVQKIRNGAAIDLVSDVALKAVPAKVKSSVNAGKLAQTTKRVLNKVNVDVTRKVNNAVKTLSKEAPAKVSEIVTQGVVDNKKEKLKEVINNPPRR